MNDLWNWNRNIPDFNTFIIIGTVNSLYGNLSHDLRFQHTVEAIDSVHRKAPGSKILYVDNSSIPLKQEWVDIITPKVDLFRQMPHNLFSMIANLPALEQKSQSEFNMLDYAFNVLRQNPQMIGKRIFKQSGRYALQDTFDLSQYDDPTFKGKYTFVPKLHWLTHDGWVTQRKVLFLEQALISFDPVLLDDLQALLPGMLNFSLKTNLCIEEVMGHFIDRDKVILLESAHVLGLKADSTPENPNYGS